MQHISFRTTHECDSTITDGKLLKNECLENHLFKPFSNENSGATTKVTQSLVFIEERDAKNLIKGDYDKRSDLSYSHDHRRSNSEADDEFVMNVLRKHPRAENSELPTLFDQLVYSLRNLRHSQMVNIYYSISNYRTKKFFQDALPLLKTDAGVTLMKDIINSREIGQDIVDNWFSSLAFYKNPTRGMLVVLSSFINDNAANSALLGISGLASTFCSNNPKCLEVPEFKEVLTRYEALLGKTCKTRTVEEELKMVLILKGIRNIGHLLHSKDILKQCLMTKSNPILVRISVLELIRKWELACSFSGSGIMEILEDIHEDSEVRINAYLALMTCPTDRNIERIRLILNNEEVNQVGSFIWTHLTNLQETKSKIGGKLFMKRIIGSDTLQNKWRSDVRKFSRNLEISHFLNDYKIGSTAESNIIFSEKSYIPRSLMMNLTLSLFGENVNLFELGGRIEGFDNMIEDVFGPDGYFKEDTVHNFLKTFSTRNKRSSENSLESFSSDIRTNEPKGSIYMRSFGKDIKFISFSGIPRTLNKILRSPFNLLNYFEDTNLNYEKSSLFLDGSIIVPTVGGLPMNMTAKGSSSIRLKSSAKINIKDFLAKGKASVDAEISPSVTIKISGTMSVDAFATKTSIKSVSKIHSSTYFGGSFDVIGSRLVQVQLKIPNEKVEIFDISVEFQKYREGDYEELNSYQKEQKFELCSSETVNTIFGLSGCAHFAYHKGRSKGDPDWFFAGSSKASLAFRKTDTFKGLIAKYSWNKNNASAIRGVINDVSIVYDTPGSNINRKTIFSVKYDDKETFLDTNMIIPALKFKFGSKYDWTKSRKVFSAKMANNEEEIFEFTQSLIRYQGKYEGISKIIFYDNPILNWIGTMYLKPGKYSLDANLKSQFHDDIVVAADFTRMRGEGKMKVVGKLASDQLKVNISMDTRNTEKAKSVDGELTYSLHGSIMQAITFSGKLLALVDGDTKIQNLNMDFFVSLSNST